MCGEGDGGESLIRGNDRSHWYVLQKCVAIDDKTEISVPGWGWRH